jgi:DNA-directed RNA polymerase subunit F
MKVLETKPITMAQAKNIMVKREKERELGYEQKTALEHLKKFSKLSAKDANKLLEEVSSVFRMSPQTAAKIVNLMPKNADEIRMIFAREKFSLKEDEINKILELVKKYK